VPGTLPGYLGIAAFGGIKFAGYSLAALGLKQFEPTIASSAVKIAAVRTGLGVVLGPLATILVVYLTDLIFFHSGNSPTSSSPDWQMALIYGSLFVVRIFVWAFVLFLFTRKAPLSGSSFWLYAFLGAIVSSLLDWPGYALAIAAPGKVTFC
jgi:hypothetical protein